VSYVSPDAPVLKPAESKSLGTAETALVAEAKSAPVYVHSKTPKSLPLWGYMGDAALLYVENIEKAFEVMTDSDIPFERGGSFPKGSSRLPLH